MSIKSAACLCMLVAQLVFAEKLKCCISLYRLGSQYIFVSLKIKHLSIAGLNLDKNQKFGYKFERNWGLTDRQNDILDNIFLV